MRRRLTFSLFNYQIDGSLSGGSSKLMKNNNTCLSLPTGRYGIRNGGGSYELGPNMAVFMAPEAVHFMQAESKGEVLYIAV